MKTGTLAYKLKRYQLSSDLHIHTNYVDGKHSVAESVKKAEENGLELIAITEHVRRHLTYDFGKLLDDIYEARGKSRLNILVGAEAKVIDLDGNLDISDEVRRKTDIVLGCFHSWFRESPPMRGEYLRASLNMITKRNADIWAHPLLFSNNKPLFETEETLELVKALKENGVFFEINLRYQCPPKPYLRLFMEQGVPWVIGSDAHCIEEIWNGSKPAFMDGDTWLNCQKLGREVET